MRVRINVTAEDIRMGRPNSYMNCPIALAMRRAGLRQPGVTDKTWDEAGEGHPLSTRAQVFVRAFDAGRPVEPFTFSVTRPDA